MKHIILAAATSALLASGAHAQAGNPGSHNPVVRDSSVGHVAAPAKGRNSFTESQAKGRIAKAGYSGILKLTKDENGVWRGIAVHHGKKVRVGLDYKGNVITR
jgi:hypothetical protein